MRYPLKGSGWRQTAGVLVPNLDPGVSSKGGPQRVSSESRLAIRTVL